VTYNRGFGNDRGQDIIKDANGNIYVTGRSENANDYDILTIIYNSSGISQWTKFYNNVDNDYGNRISLVQLVKFWWWDKRMSIPQGEQRIMIL
jgi:hypothetical protein